MVSPLSRTAFRLAIVLGALSFILIALGQPSGVASQGRPGAGEGTYIMIQLQDPPAASYEGGVGRLQRTKPLQGKFDPESKAAQVYLRHLENEHASYRSWLARNAPQAEIVREYSVVFNGIAIRLNGAAAERAAGGPGARAWAFSSLYRPTMNISTDLIGASDLWGASPQDAGKGIEVAIIDTGIQNGHPFFDCKGSSGIPAIDHHGPYFSGVAPGAINPFPTILFDHGTHVAGTVGGCVSDLATIDPDGPITGTMSGIVPGVTLHDYNVFPGIGGGLLSGGGAFSHDIAAAIEDAVKEGVDVINMSLGGKVQGPHDFLAEASDAAVDAGVVVVAAAGNSGPGDSTAESPGSAAKVIAAGASTNPHYIGIPVTVGSTTYGAALGDFDNFDVVSADFTVTTPANGCSAISTDVSGKIALIDRGVCAFTVKVLNAEAAGAIGALVVNNVAGDPVAMGHTTSLPLPGIPAAMLSKADGNAIKPSGTASIDGSAPAEFLTSNADIIAGFSSRGPTPFTSLIKPDVSAPGVNVYSSVFSFGPEGFGDIEYDFEMFQGTSMSTPHTAGSAALLLYLHADWSPADVKSALVDTGARVVTDHVNAAVDPGVLARGGGRIDLVAADAAPLTIDPPSASFGAWGGNKPVSGSLDLAVHNVSGGSQSCSASVSGPGIVSASTGTISLGPGADTSVTLTLNAGRAGQTGSGDYEGDLIIDCSTGSTLRVPWWVRIDRGGKP